MSADDDIRHSKCHNRVFDGCGYATRFRAERGDDITGVADNEKLSGILLSNEFWHQAAIGTGDEKRFRILAGCQAAKEFLALRENLFLEVEEALNDMLHSSVSFLCLSRL
ncbi:hypothetical protein SDC9_163241 [bioreactor metagenome]|uniref:Uncharacterized protein n=1 Tax=bioreactor metagenome TaxID=1076179 RepID=A0A645FNA5_9ZZZZ